MIIQNHEIKKSMTTLLLPPHHLLRRCLMPYRKKPRSLQKKRGFKDNPFITAP
jgi:hypothetical protein